jgi:hypothetical protein
METGELAGDGLVGALVGELAAMAVEVGETTGGSFAGALVGAADVATLVATAV